MHVAGLLLATAVLGTWAQTSGGGQKSVIVSLNAKWKSTSLIAEASEYVAKEGNDEFWKFVNNVAEKSASLDWTSLTPEQKYRLAEQQTVATLGKSTDLLDLSLSLRTFSPVVQLCQQIGSEHSSTCEAFFDVHGTVSCNVDELEKAVDKAAGTPSQLLSVDHIYPTANTSKTTIIVYGDLGSPELTVLHKKAAYLARQYGLQYALRHYQKDPKGSMSLSGYGVELAIKNTEYKAMDDSKKEADGPAEDEEDLHGFNFKVLKQLHKQSTEGLDQLRMHLKDIDELVPLKQWQVQDLSYQAAQWVVDKEKEDGTGILQLKELSQNFPLHARDISRVYVEKSFRDEIENNAHNSFEKLGLEAGESALYLNGINVDIDTLDIFDLVDTLKQEEQLSAGFHSMDINREYLSILTGLDLSDEKVSYALDYRDAYPFYLNNLDSDKKYKQWGNSVKLMLQPYYPGMIRPIARNLFNLVFVVDPSSPESRGLMKIGQSFYQHDIPLRIGYIFAVNPDKTVSGKDDVGVAILNLFNFLTVDETVPDAMKTVIKLMDQHRGSFTAADIKSWFIKNYADSDYEEVFGVQTDYDKGRTAGAEFMARTAIGKAPKVLLNGYVLDDAGIKGDKFEETVMMEVMKVSPKIQRAVMNGQLTDRHNVGNWLLEQKDVMPRLNARVLDAPMTKKYIDFSNIAACKAKTLAQFAPLSSAEKSQCLLEKTSFLTKSEEQNTMSSTLLVVSDLETPTGRELVYNAIKHLKHSKSSRVGIILNPTDETTACQPNSISSLVHASLRLLPRQQAKQFITKLVKEEFAGKLIAGQLEIDELAVGGMSMEYFNKERKLLSCDKMKMEAKYSTDVLGLKTGQSAVLANGLVIGPLNEGELLEEADYVLMEKMLANRGAALVAERVDKWEVEKENGKSSDLVLRISSLIGRHAAAKKRTWVVLTGDEHSAVTLVADHDKPAVDIVAIVDPLSMAAQKLSPVLEILREAVNCDMKIVMNPKPKLSELPLKRFYRYVASAKPQFQQGDLIANSASFAGLPSKQLLTLSLQAPDAWMVENVYAEYDLDNIKMAQVSSDVVALFSLEHILLEGHCFDEVSGNPPRGLQFVLGTPSNPTKYDTIVMANLGYFQLKANPGAWQLRLREGRSKDIYKLTGTTNTEAQEEEVVTALIDSFSGRTIRVRVAKQEGKEDQDLLSDTDGGWGLNMFSGEKSPETINVFSLASGHLYERFMRIMIVSVMKKTKSPVKFWLLKNYLSPQFKESLPIMAKEYGFEYALVEYKWPRWLHQQKEKQRVMWGYKILFLDVLFPLDVQKIIFVDADQIVRADLMELMEFDLEGAPYGYVPFCESRKEMDGFRFWKTGYWANHLAGRKYHISALYVIDLQKFRQVAAGDRLRGQYQGLSSDPNSLANLDQDLPNNMIHQVKIKSLPQEWLWCETWCDDASKKSAKTIDLCNNPQTKEPKLDSASRIVTEWDGYDQEIKKLLAGETKKKDSHIEL